MAEIYNRRLEGGKAQDYQKEQDLAIEYFRKAVALQKKSGLETDRSHSLNNLATFYYFQGRYSEAELLYLQALEISDRTLGSNHPQTILIRENLNKLSAEI